MRKFGAVLVVLGTLGVAACQSPQQKISNKEDMLSGAGARLKMLVLHDDAAREYAYGPAAGLPDTKVGALTAALYGEAKKDGWPVISMKNDWKRIFPFE